jgi:hypothetical protein
VWYFDRGTVVRTTGMDIFEDLPFFILLLAILQRMDQHDFGQHPAFEPVRGLSLIDLLGGRGQYEFDVEDAQGQSLRLRFTPNSRPLPLSFLGRGTAVSDVEIVGDSTSCGMDLSKYKLVAKIYHPEQSRTSEVDILKHAYNVAQQDNPADFFPSGLKPSNDASYARGHLPVLLGYAEHDEPCTQALDMFGVKPAGRRLMRILLFVKLKEMTKLTGEEYLKAFLDCLLCKFDSSFLLTR